MTSLIRYIQNINRQTAWSFCPIRRLAARTAISGLALSLSLFGIAKPATAATTTLSFNSTPVLVSGTDRTQGAVYRFANVFAGVDALVQVETIQNAQLKVIDDNSSFPARFQPVIAPASTSLINSRSYVRFNFKLTPSSTPNTTSFAAAPAATATNVYFSAQDVDGNGALNTIREFVETIGAVTSYVANPTSLQRMTTSLPVAGGIGYEQSNSSNVQPGIGTDDFYEFYSYLGASVSSFSIIGGNITGTAGCTLNNTGCDRQNSWTFDVADVQKLDFGDAPISYGDAYHPVPPSPSVFLGALVEGDDSPNYTVGADGDDLTGVDDEDGVASFPTLLNSATNYSLNLTCVGNAPVAGWIDFNKNGTFENAIERASGTCNSGTVTLNWTGLSGLTAGTTYARFRTATIAAEVANPIGQASNGEVEDYRITISTPPITVSGTVFRDADGNVAINGSDVGTNAGSANLTVYAIDSAGKVAAKASVATNGTYSFANFPQNANLTLRLSNDASFAIGATAPTAPSLPANWVNTGESKNGVTETTTLGDIAITTATTSIANQNFGIEQLPDTNNVSSTSQTNPGGTVTVQVPTLAGTDPEDGAIGGGNRFKIVTLPTNGILYYNNIAVTTGQIIANYDPTKLTLDPNDGAITVSFTYAAVDAASQVDASPATVTMPFFSPVSISGVVFNDINTNQVQNGTEAGLNPGGLNAVLVNGANQVVATTAVAANGTYTFSGVPANATYTVLITTATPTIGAAPPAVILPAGWVSTGENLNGAIDGAVDGKLTVPVAAVDITAANFGIQKPADYSDAPTSGTAPNGSGTNAYGDASHIVVSTIKLGAAIDADPTSLASANADGDGADDDGITLPALTAGATSYSIPAANIVATNTSSTTATIHAWIDFNKNGVFESSEYASAIVNSGVNQDNPAGSLNWSGITVGSSGYTFARFRLTTDGTVTNSTPSGIATDGEVEDYQLAIAPLNGISLSGTLFEDRNRDDLLTSSEPGLPSGTIVRLLNGSDPSIEISTTTTDANGRYSFPNISNGNYIVQVDTTTVPSNYLIGTNKNIAATVSNASVVVNFPFDVVNIAGTVFEDFDGSNIQNGSEFGLSSVTVSLFQDLNNDGILNVDDDTNADGRIDSSDSFAITVTDFDGNYGFNVPDGNYLVLVDSADSSLGNRPYGGAINSPNNPLNNPRNADISGSSVATNLDFPFDVGSPPDICNGKAYTPLSFENPTLVAGTSLSVNAVYRFPNVTSGIDALVRITSLNNGAVLTAIDGTGGEASALQPVLNSSPNADSSVDLEITFVIAGTDAQAAISSFSAAGLDIDGDGDPLSGGPIGSLREYIELTNFSAYRLETPTTLTATYSPPTGRFESATTQFQPGISVGVKPAIAVGDFENVSQFRYRVGAIDSANSTTDRLNSLFFGCIEFANQNTSTTAYSISGTLYRDDDGSDSFNNGESTLPAGISVNLLNGGDVVATTITDSNGQYVFTSVTNGSYAVQVNTDDANIPNGALLGTPNNVSVTVNNGNSQPINFGFDTVPVASDPNVLLVKRITSVNRQTTNPNDGTALNQFVDDTVSPQSDDDNNANWPSNYLIGAINGGSARPISNNPADMVEYSIYFLSAGNAEAKSVLVCDRIPQYTSFIANSYAGILTPDPQGTPSNQLGIALDFNGSQLALTGENDGDAGYYFAPGVEPSSVFPSVNCGGTNDNGAVVVNLKDLPAATGSGNPANSFGAIRFQVEIK